MTDKERSYWELHIKRIDQRNKQLVKENNKLKQQNNFLKYDLEYCESLKNRLIQELNLIKANSILKENNEN